MLENDIRISISNSQTDWPAWEIASDEENYQLAKITVKYIRFLLPSIVQAITLNNNLHYEKWCKILLNNGVNSDLYLWKSSPCCFPGIRRYAGSKEIASFRKHVKMEKVPNALKLDDNDFPKQIWSFVFRGKVFNKFGPTGYSLAHLSDHKEYNNRMEKELEFIAGHEYSSPYYGLYTCPTNTVFIPNSLIKPTDFNTKLRILLFQKAESLYKDYCNILPPYIKIPKVIDERWDIKNFEWADCVGTMDNIVSFFQYRDNFMKQFEF